MAKRSPLVCQHLENVSRDVLEEHQDIIREYVRHRQGVYALYRRGKLYYVGLASNLRTRLSHHLKDRHGESWDRFSVYVTIGDSHLRELESLLLRIVKTKGNKQKGKFAKSEDLRRNFARDAKRSWQIEMQDLLGLPAARHLWRAHVSSGCRLARAATLVPVGVSTLSYGNGPQAYSRTRGRFIRVPTKRRTTCGRLSAGDEVWETDMLGHEKLKVYEKSLRRESVLCT